jgi:hypothetical protein
MKDLIGPLEIKVKYLEDKIENDDDFVNSDDFTALYEELKEETEDLSDIGDSLPDNASDKLLGEFNIEMKKYKKLLNRIKVIEDEAGIESEDDIRDSMGLNEDEYDDQ